MSAAVRAILAAALSVGPAAARAGQLVEVVDLSYFQKPQPVIFPGAEIKVCLLEFEAAGGEPRGKELTKELHAAYLARIHDLAGGAVVTWVAGPGMSIANFRAKAEEVGRAQRAQLAVWGRVLVDAKGIARLAPRLTLLVAPPGISAAFEDERLAANGPVAVRGVLEAPIAVAQIEFAPTVGEVKPLAVFLSGLARYYKGAARTGPDAVRWLAGSAAELEEYVRLVPETADPGALAHAHLFAARALVRLARTRQPGAGAEADLLAADRHAAAAARLNPYDPSAPRARAVIARLRRAPRQAVRTHLAEAVRLAPADAQARLDLAVHDAAAGEGKAALKSIDQARQVQRIMRAEESPQQRRLEDDIKAMK